MLTLTQPAAPRTLHASELEAPHNAVLHNVISFHFKAHPRFLEAASFAWPSASWHFPV